ncbi:MAG: YicC family protein [Candidatus Solibacter sp.]|nr:YicC family protein [Candidatus Solibacter sp.]
MSIRSMTGFARIRRSSPAGEAVATIKSVNHRALDLHLHLAAELEAIEPRVRDLARRHVRRGHVDIRLSFVPAHSKGQTAFNRALFETWLATFDIASNEYNVHSTPDLNQALLIPGMLAASRDADLPEDVEALALGALDDAFAAHAGFRAREGAQLVDLMKEANARVRSAAGEIAALRDQVLPYMRQRLEDRLTELLAKNLPNPDRLAQEAAVLADRSDIAEEIGRLSVHAAELDQMLTSGVEIGKKLDFLLQEMNRETNTILSKSSGAGEIGLRVTGLGLDAKTNIERIREQGLNIE